MNALGDVVSFSNPEEVAVVKPVEEVIEDLQGLLKLAQEGRLRTFAISYILDSSEVVNGWTGSENPHLLMAGISYLSHRYATIGPFDDYYDDDPPKGLA